MRSSSKKWVKIGLMMAIIPCLLAGSIYFIVVKHLKEVLEYAVEKQTNGAYTFHSKAIQLSFTQKAIRIDSSTLHRRDTVNVPLYYDVRIPNAYLSITSWRDLVFHNRLSVDSFAVINPQIVVHDYREPSTKPTQAPFRSAMVLEQLQKTLTVLRGKSITIDKASFSLFRRTNSEPLRVRDISLRVRNFQKIDTTAHHFLASDALELDLGPQRWALPDGKHRLSFKGLRLSSTRDLFEIDSVHFLKPATASQGQMSLQADKFYFNSRHLAAMYLKGELDLDTLICVRPVLVLPVAAKKVGTKDTTLTTNLKTLFTGVTIRYTAIQDGELVLAGQARNALKAGTQKANLTIHRLRVNPRKEEPFSVDSVNMNLHHIAFYSKDSLFKISVEQFVLKNKAIFFRQVRYGPASPRTAGRGMTFQAPLLHLKNVNVFELLRKRLVASDAELINPVITLTATYRSSARKETADRDTLSDTKTDIYHTLHSFADLLEVDRFHIVNGQGAYQLVGGRKPVRASVKTLNTTIAVKELLASDSLIHIKRAIPDLRIQHIQVATRELGLQLTNYRMDGKRRLNWVDKLVIELGTGTSVIANKIYWEAFSWDVLQTTKVIQIDKLRVQELMVDAKLPPKPLKTASGAGTVTPVPTPRLPRLRIGQLMADRLAMKAALPNQRLAGFEGRAIHITRLTTDPRFFRWSQFLGQLQDVYYHQPDGKQVSIARVALHSHEHTTLSQAHYADQPGGLEITMPMVQIKGPFPSTDFSTIQLSSIRLDRPTIALTTPGKSTSAVVADSAPKAFRIPLTLVLQELDVAGARVQVIAPLGRDSVQLQTRVDLVARSLRAKKGQNATFGSIRVNSSEVKLAVFNQKATAPVVNVLLTNGKLVATPAGRPGLTTHLQADVLLQDVHPSLKSRKNTTPPELTAKTIRAQLDMPQFNWTAGKKTDWSTFLSHANVAIAELRFKSATSLIRAQKASWSHQGERLQLDTFQLSPILTKAEFMSPPHLQSDYIQIKGDMAQVNGLKLDRWRRDSLLVVRQIVVKNIVTDVSRDKRLLAPSVVANKPMPTQLLKAIRVPFHIDSLRIINGQVTYQETSKRTDRVATIPLRGINGTLSHVTNRPRGSGDSLRLVASTKLLGLQISRLHYRESYWDSLAGFRLLLKTSDLHLPELTSITHPMASARLQKGYLEPMTARIAGNQYASVGMMRFHYKELTVQLQAPKDTAHRSLLIRLENFAASILLRKNNRRDGFIYYDRDRQSFVFSYWLKSLASGVLSSVGVPRSRKSQQNYLKLRQQHILPAEE